MGRILDQMEGSEPAAPDDAAVACPICARPNRTMQYCRHVRWTFDQGDPLDFARFALETSPYTHNLGLRVGQIPAEWWEANGDWLLEQVLFRFDARDGYVFGEHSDVDLLARDVWQRFTPQDERADIARKDLFAG